jgi:RimJ/RimL family protein N-acetyltransferase
MDRVDVSGERDELSAWLTQDEWPFHANLRLTTEQVEQFIDDGLFDGPGIESFWISYGDYGRVGLLRIFDMDPLGQDAPRFDIRIGRRFRNREIGRQAVLWMTDYLFGRWPLLERIEGTTRGDNIAMQTVFVRCGFVKEGHLRRAWRSADNSIYDAIIYAIIRSDWSSAQPRQSRSAAAQLNPLK